MTKRIFLSVIVLAVAFAVGASVMAAPQGTGKIEGIAKDANQKPLAGVTVQCRNTATGQIVGTQQTSSTGAFSFTGLLPGTYVVEIVDRDGKIIGVSAGMQLTPAAMAITGVAIAATAAGAVAGAAAAGGGLGAFLSSTTGLLVLGGVAAATVAGVIIATRSDASPSK
jgi:hypothetical protein